MQTSNTFQPAYGHRLGPLWRDRQSREAWGHYAIDVVPSADLAPVHEPQLVAMLWCRLLGTIREPIQTATVAGLRTAQVLGGVVVRHLADGQVAVSIWQRGSGNRATLVEAEPEKVIAQGMPWRRLWLGNMVPLAAMQVQRWHEYHGGAPSLPLCDQYAAWAFDIFARRLARSCDLRLMRQRVAHGLALDAWALKMASRVPRPHIRDDVASFADYNLVIRHRADFELLQSEAPNLISLYAACCEAGGFPDGQQPVARLKAYLKAKGISERGWRLIAHANGRLLKPLRTFYRGGVAHTATEHLRLLDELELRRQPPAWFIQQFLATWGDPGNRVDSYVNDIDRAKSLWRHVANALPHEPGAQLPTRDEFDVIRRWIDRTGPRRHLDKPQRRAGWAWLLRSAQEWAEAQQREHALSRDAWPVPFESATVDQWQLVALSTELDLWNDARALYHCADTFASRCRAGGCAIVSVRRAGRRVATAQISPVDGTWRLRQIKGPANSAVDEELAAALRTYVGQLPAPQPSRRSGTEESVDVDSDAVDAQVDQPGCGEMGGDRFEQLVSEALERLRNPNNRGRSSA